MSHFSDWAGFETLLRKRSICKVPGVFSKTKPYKFFGFLSKVSNLTQSKNGSNHKLHLIFLGSTVLEKLNLECEFRTLEAKISRKFQFPQKKTEENYKLFSIFPLNFSGGTCVQKTNKHIVEHLFFHFSEHRRKFSIIWFSSWRLSKGERKGNCFFFITACANKFTWINMLRLIDTR